MAEVLSRNDFSKLIGSICDCALNPELWEKTLWHISDVLNSPCAVSIGTFDRREGRFVIGRTACSIQYPHDKQRRYSSEMDYLTQMMSSQVSIDEPQIISRHIPASYKEVSPYFREFWPEYGLVDIMQYVLDRTPSRYVTFRIGHHEREGITSDRDIKICGLLLPHVRRAVMISNALDAVTIERARFAETLDAFRCGVVMTDDRGLILHTNRAAEDMLQSGERIQDIRGVLRAKAPQAAKELRAAIMLAAHDEAEIGKAGLGIRLTEPDEAPVFARILPLTGGVLRTRVKPAAVAAVFITATPDEQDTADKMAAAFSLTPAERRVLASLLAGRTLAETALGLEIAVTTTKTHLDNIFLKTGVGRQAELMRLAMQVAPPIGSQAQ